MGGAVEPEHSSYAAIVFDADGEQMTGSNGPYSVTTEVPPVDAFWPVTVHYTERGGYLIARPSRRSPSTQP